MIRVEDRPGCEQDRRLAADLVLFITARTFSVDEAELRLSRRSEKRVAFARQVAMYLLHVVFGGTYQEAGRSLGRERTTVAYACSLVEDERDDAVFDRQLDDLEAALVRLWYIEKLRRLMAFNPGAEDQVAA